MSLIRVYSNYRKNTLYDVLMQQKIRELLKSITLTSLSFKKI